MNLYLISQSENDNYDTYDSAVVCDENEDDAIQIHPDGNIYPKWDKSMFKSWASCPENVSCEYIGKADKNIKAGSVVISSYNAG
jgi:hypothetical protein